MLHERALYRQYKNRMNRNRRCGKIDCEFIEDEITKMEIGAGSLREASAKIFLCLMISERENTSNECFIFH